MEKSWNCVFEFLWEPCSLQHFQNSIFLTTNMPLLEIDTVCSLGLQRSATWVCKGLQPGFAKVCNLGLQRSAAWVCKGLQPGFAIHPFLPHTVCELILGQLFLHLTPGGGTLIFSHIRRLGPFFWVQNSEFLYFLGFSEK